MRQGFEQVRFHPYRRAHKPCHAREAVPPFRPVPEVVEQEMDKQSDPYLPFDRVLVRPDEVRQLERLLELLEEDLHRPAGPVELRDGLGGPVHVVGYEGHLPDLPSDLHACPDAAELPRVLVRRHRAVQLDRLVGEDAPAARHGAGRARGHVLLPAQDEEDSPLVEAAEEGEVKVGLVRDKDVARPDREAELGCFPRVVVRRVFDDDDGGHERRDVYAHMRLRGGLPAPMLRPVDAGQRQLDDGRVDREDPALEPVQEPPASPRGGEPLAGRRQVRLHSPVEPLRDQRIPRPVGVRERVALRGRDAADPRKAGGMDRAGVADLVEAERVRQMPEHQRDDMAPDREPARVDAHLVGDFLYRPARNQLDDLVEGGIYCRCCFLLFVHCTL